MSDRLIGAVEAIYDAAPDPGRWPHALQAIADVFGDVGALLIWRRDDGRFGTVVSESLQVAQRDYEENGWSMRELRALRTAERGYFFRGEPFTDRDICSAEEIKTDPVYTGFCRKHAIGWFGGVTVSPDPSVGVALSIQRNSALKPPFSAEELEIVGRLGRHAEKSLRLSIRLLDSELGNLGLGKALARIGIAVFALDSLGRVVFSNQAARDLPAEHISVVQDRLRVSHPEARRAVESALDTAFRGGTDLLQDARPLIVHRTQGEQPLALYVLPLTSPNPDVGHFLVNTRAIVLVIDPKPDDPPDPAVVRDILGLTLGEARVAALVSSGLPPREAASQLGITEETARTTLKRVFAKTGVSRQIELAALLAKLVLR